MRQKITKSLDDENIPITLDQSLWFFGFDYNSYIFVMTFQFFDIRSKSLINTLLISYSLRPLAAGPTRNAEHGITPSAYVLARKGASVLTNRSPA